eukprot:TRINITY_DN23105_c2_g1_i1.p1 TRINITY_DN23105_c2_g1~~TRINITY_DN23105_c2_g1_i1.p1  ORF type:complete len:502 (-),score=60.94 TRINITY_DN23105_c2_g1_i1:167-1672(-)
MTMADGEELEEYEEYEEQEAADAVGDTKKGYVGVHSVSFQDMCLKESLIRAIKKWGFEHPSEIQQQCIPPALQGQDILGQAKSGMGKTAVFVLSVLHQLEVEEGKVQVLVVCHTHELASQIEAEFERFAFYMEPKPIVASFVGGIPKKQNLDMLSKPETCPSIVIGTPGRLLDLVSPDRRGDKPMDISNVKYFIVDECDKILDQLDMRTNVQKIFFKLPKKKQTMMYSATMTDDMRNVAKKMMNDPIVKTIEESKLVLEGLVQYYSVITESEKNKYVCDLLDNLDFNQAMIFVKSIERAKGLAKLLEEAGFPAKALHGKPMPEAKRQEIMKAFKENPNEVRILVSTDLASRGVDVERVNVVINYDMTESSDAKGSGVDTYLHRVGRAGRFGTRGIAVTLISTKEETDLMNLVQEKLDIGIDKLPASLSDIDRASYCKSQVRELLWRPRRPEYQQWPCRGCGFFCVACGACCATHGHAGSPAPVFCLRVRVKVSQCKIGVPG